MAEATRDVIYTLRVVHADDVKRQIESFTKAMTTAQSAATNAAKKEASEQEKISDRVFRNRVKLLDRMAKEERKKAEEARKEREKEAREVERLASAATQKIGAASSRLREGFNLGTEGVLKLGRGIATLGVAGEKDMKKLIESLVRIQAAFDIAKGAIDTYVAISESVRAYRQAVEAATVAETALAGARARSAAAGGASLAGGGRAALAGAGATGVGGLGLAGAGAAAAFGVGAAAMATSEFIMNLRSGGHEVGAFTGAVQNAYRSIGSFVGGLFGFKNKIDQINLNSELMNSTRQSQMEMDTFGTQQGIAFNDRRMNAATMGLDDESGRLRRSRLEKAELGSIRGRLERNRTVPGETMTVGQRMALIARQSELHERGIRSAREELNLRRQMADTQKAAADETLQKTQHEIDLRKSVIDAEQNRLTTAKERFGGLSSEDQQRAILAKQKADAGGSLSREEASILRGIGTSGAAGLAQAADIGRANAAGFDKFFGGEERLRIATAQNEKAKLEIDLKNTQDIKVKIDKNFDDLKSQITKQIVDQVSELNKSLEEEIQASLQQEFARQAQANLSRQNQIRVAQK